MSNKNASGAAPTAVRTRGQGMTEYIIIVALIAIAAIGVVTLFGDNIRSLFSSSEPARVEQRDDRRDDRRVDRRDDRRVDRAAERGYDKREPRPTRPPSSRRESTDTRDR